MSLKSQILNFIHSQYPSVVHKGVIGRLAVLEWNFENENAGRRCRELENEGLIEKVPHPKGEAQYRWIEKPELYSLPSDFIKPKIKMTPKMKEASIKMVNEIVARISALETYKRSPVEVKGLFN